MKTLQTRREFIKQGSIAAAAAPLLGASVLRAQTAAPGRKLGFAVCGLGNLSTHQIAPALQQTQYCQLTGIVTGHPYKAERWKAQYNIPDKNVYNYDNMGDMANNPDIDVVYVVTPNGLHAEHTIKAARAGKHVLSEKPMEVSVEKCQQMIDECKKAGKQLAIGYRLHFEPNNLECIRLGREKVFGDLKLIEAGFGGRQPNPNVWRFNKELAGGGPLMDMGIYALQATRYLSGEEPVEVSGITTVTNPDWFKEIEESIVWEMKFPSGLIAKCSSTYNFSGMQRFTVYAADGWYELNPAFGYWGPHGTRSDGQAIEFPPMNQFAAEMDDFAQCILENRPTRVPGEEGLRDVKIMLAIYEAAQTGRTVSLS
ncbi:MAG TPA: Gfo/Idh/MocA family oxidoreductase [Candidatus Sulfotelmatobacter sp.]|nr:Gfo/Idh/MocA family oxidoreductase [Candidatus Sulfotelmatobacter sp.]